jgi:hypothetical protein
MVPAVDVSEWGSNFLGFEDELGRPIRSVRFGGEFGVLDGLTFEAVPEPENGLLLSAGLAFFAIRHRLSCRESRSQPPGHPAARHSAAADC